MLYDTKYNMNRATRALAATELLLLAPAAFFLSAFFMRTMQPPQPESFAGQIVTWYAHRQWTLWVLLLALPFAALVTGCAALRKSWNRQAELRQSIRETLAAIRAYPATALVAVATLAAGGVLMIVVLHMAAN